MTTESIPVSVQDQKFYGLSSDTKPTDGVSAKATFKESDTGDEYEYSGTTWKIISSGGAAHVSPTQLANEENPGTNNAYGTALRKWRELDFNPRAASSGSTVGAAATAGTTEVLIDAGVPILVGAIIFESDNAGNALLRNTGALANSVQANQFDVNADIGCEFTNGLTICGTAAGTAFKLLYRAL